MDDDTPSLYEMEPGIYMPDDTDTILFLKMSEVLAFRGLKDSPEFRLEVFKFLRDSFADDEITVLLIQEDDNPPSLLKEANRP